MLEVQIIKTSRIGLELIGQTITHVTKGEGVVIGYSAVKGEPFVFFMKTQISAIEYIALATKNLFRIN